MTHCHRDPLIFTQSLHSLTSMQSVRPPLSSHGRSPEDTRVRQIFRYLAEAGESRTTPVRTLDGARHLLWFHDLPSEFLSFLDSEFPAEEPLWLLAERPVQPDPPRAGQLLRPWLDPAEVRNHQREQAPQLRGQAEVREEIRSPDGNVAAVMRTVLLDDFPRGEAVQDLHRAWAPQWEQWATEKRLRSAALRSYEKLYRIHEDITSLGENFELVLAFGYLTWSAESEPIRRHLVTARAVLAFDERTGAIRVAPDPEAGTLLLEEGMLDAAQKARANVREFIRGQLEAAGDATARDRLDPLHQALESWALAAHQAGRYQTGTRAHRPVGLDVPLVSFAPALILRERTRRSTLDVLRRIAQQVDQGAQSTELLRFIAGGSDTDPSEGNGAVTLPAETYFALPSNEEQRTIAERLRSNRLVVVQGPPGTGKTHTIANLVTDLLAHGQRVLITSHTARALKVLKDKLPEGVRELCVSRTDDGIAAQRELEASIRALLDRQGSYSRRDYERRIGQHEEKLRRARDIQALTLKELRVLREQETYVHPSEIGDYSGTLQNIAARLSDERSVFDWLGPVPGPTPLVTSEQVRALLDATRAFSPGHRALAASAVGHIPGGADLPAPNDFAAAVAAIRSADEEHARIGQDPGTARLDDAIGRLTDDQQVVLGEAMEAFTAAVATAAAEQAGWAAPLRADVLIGRDRTLRSRLEMTTSALTGARAAEQSLGGALVTGMERYDVGTALGQATTLYDGLRSGERLRGPLGLKTKLRKAVGDFVDAVRVDGRPPEDEATASTVLHRAMLERHLQVVEREWSGGGEPWQSTARRTAQLEQDAATLQTLAALAGRRAGLVAAAGPVAALAAVPWHVPETTAAVRDVLRVRAGLRVSRQARNLITTAEDTLRTAAHQRSSAAPALEHALAAVVKRDVEAYASACSELDGLREALRLKKECDAAYEAVAAVLPALANALDDTSEDTVWDARLADVERAWAWSAWTARLRELTDPAAEGKQRRILAEADDEIRIRLERLAADRAWYSCLERLTDEQAVALTSYQQSVRRLGKGTGKYAHQYRRQARESLRECQDAVPAWIMPLYQVAETVPVDRPSRFDVIIIDEASQSGPEALLLAWLGAKIVVVGDDKQVSPANVGIDQEQYFQLQQRILADLPASRQSLFSPTASFFDIASGLAGGRGRLMLQEHFRCMPEIIGFSNAWWYEGKLQPLRQYGADRLQPLRPIYVPSGHIEGTGQRQINRPEAERLVDELVRCCDDPAYQGHTIGVITLLGQAQRHLIEDMLAERLPLAERQQRRLRVGDAEDFQGDERDVIFISLVVSMTRDGEQKRAGAFVATGMQQRLNVAASRARDQVWVFHSVAITELGETDLRRAYLDYLNRPAEEQDGLGLGEVSPHQRHEAFDSLFEQRVFLALRKRGYRVRPQYPVGRYRIDLVVEGGTKRLAVECDGDAFHNEENADADAARQRELERVGWTFVRIRGSRFFLDPDRALEPLWLELDRLGIESTNEKPKPTAAIPTPVPERLPPSVPAAPSVPALDAVPSPHAPSVAAASPVTPPVEPSPSGAPAVRRHSAPSPRSAPESAAQPARRTTPAEAQNTGPHSQPIDYVRPPAGYRSVGWIRRDEVNAAQHAFAIRAAVPFDEGGFPAGRARHLRHAGIPGHAGADVVELKRGEKLVALLLQEEIQAMVRASIGRTDVPVFVGNTQTGLAQYFPPSSPEALKFRSTLRLLRTRTPGMTTARPQAPSHPRTSPASPAPKPAATPRSATKNPTADTRTVRDPHLPVERLSVNAYRRVQDELGRIYEALAQPDAEIIAVDSSSRSSQLEAARRRRLHLEKRRDYLRLVLAHASPDPNHSGGHLVTPGCLIGIEDEDEVGITVYEIAALKSRDAESLTPDSALGKALLWREVGDEITYQTESGTRLTVTIRYIQD
ncbi:AAA domain-containing protein [Streptomyces sp. NPDC001530]|uniref:AAA domain-containing protein n=1 Tax=Streptomyces sp. NPDC001530 TaxID=3364582 RepID=UPI0036CC3A79